MTPHPKQPQPAAGGWRRFRPAVNWLIAACLLLAGITAGCAAGPTSSPAPSSGTAAATDTIAAATLQRYRVNEVRDYQGSRLDPAIGPRDNSIQGIPAVDMATYRLKISGLVERPQELTVDAVLLLPAAERLITLTCVEGWDATILWRGVVLEELIDLAGPSASANTVIFHAVDGYTTSLPLDLIRQKDLILASQANGLVLPPAMGYPFIVVAEAKLGYKWARWVQEIELSADSDYRGYWESNGFDNDADITP